MDKLVVYHGTDCLFDQIDLGRSKDRRDFGKGFYTTTIPSQAESWAKNVRIRHNTSCSYIYEYEFSPMGDLAICSFPGLTLEWLDFIRDNRSKGGVQHQFDVVMGPVANDNTLLTVNRYIQGVYTADEALRRLAYFRANDQVSFHTEKAIGSLRLLRRYALD